MTSTACQPVPLAVQRRPEIQIHLETKDAKMLADGVVELTIKLSILFPGLKDGKVKSRLLFLFYQAVRIQHELNFKFAWVNEHMPSGETRGMKTCLCHL